MSIWNYRIVRTKDGYLKLFEVHYDDDGHPIAFCESGFDVPFENQKEMAETLRMMIQDAEDSKKKGRYLKESDFFGKGKYVKYAKKQKKIWDEEMKNAKPLSFDEFRKEIHKH